MATSAEAQAALRALQAVSMENRMVISHAGIIQDAVDTLTDFVAEHTPKRQPAVARVYKRNGEWRVNVKGEELPERFTDLPSAMWLAGWATHVVRAAAEAFGQVEAVEIRP